jgi:putative flippase GtrA
MKLSVIFQQMIRFNLVGVLNTLVDFSLFFLLNAMGMPYLPSQACSYSCGIANSYVFNKYWTFRVSRISAAEIARFATINLTALALSLLFVYLFHSLLHFSLAAAKIAATLLTMLVSFCGARLWVFKVAEVPSPDR